MYAAPKCPYSKVYLAPKCLAPNCLLRQSVHGTKMYRHQNVLAPKCHGAKVSAPKCLAPKFLAPKCVTALFLYIAAKDQTQKRAIFIGKMGGGVDRHT